MNAYQGTELDRNTRFRKTLVYILSLPIIPHHNLIIFTRKSEYLHSQQHHDELLAKSMKKGSERFNEIFILPCEKMKAV